MTQLTPGQKAETDHSKTQILLQLARWMAHTGQGASTEITGRFPLQNKLFVYKPYAIPYLN